MKDKLQVLLLILGLMALSALAVYSMRKASEKEKREQGLSMVR